MNDAGIALIKSICEALDALGIFCDLSKAFCHEATVTA